MQSLLRNNHLKRGVIFTCDPYSKIMNESDKSTNLLFGDAATASICDIDKSPYRIGFCDHGTKRGSSSAMSRREGEYLYMNAKQVMKFVFEKVPTSIKTVLRHHRLQIENIDQFVVHQGSRYIVDALANELNVDKNKMPFLAMKYGNTISSSLPLALKETLETKNPKTTLLSSFGAGCHWATTVLFKD